MDLIIVGAFLVVGYSSGRYFEKRHYSSLQSREQELIKVPVVTSEWAENLSGNCDYKLYGAGVVIASDYFKTFFAGLINIVGGRMTVYESLLDRGRREAILRLKEKAVRWGAEEIINLRVETAILGGRQLSCMEIYAYGTAVKAKKPHAVQTENPA